MQKVLKYISPGWGWFQSTDTENRIFEMPFDHQTNVPVDILEAILTSFTNNMPLELYFHAGIHGDWSVVAYNTYTIATIEGITRSGLTRCSLQTDKYQLTQQLMQDIKNDFPNWCLFYNEPKITEAKLTVLFEKLAQVPM